MGRVKLGFLGAGNMAGAIIGGVTDSKMMRPDEIGIFDISAEKLESYRWKGFNIFGGVTELVEACDTVLLAIKPQSFDDAMPLIKAGMSPEKLIISIAAGITAGYIKEGVGFDCKLVLAMPNTPLLLGCGATALSVTPPATQEDYELAKSIFASAGVVEQIPPDKMNEIIPVNGSSPAFFYYFAKALLDNAAESGISREAAYPLICQTMIGSAKMMLDSGKTPQELIDMVCSPGGTTIQGMKALEDNGFAKAVDAAFNACVDRARELQGGKKAAPPPVAVMNPGGAPWYEESVFYQISTLGFCGAPERNDGNTQSRINKVLDWIPHMLETGVNAVYFCPVFESGSHGYDTIDYSRIDCRLGTNQDFAQVCGKLHENGIKVVLDGVFNHVGRDFWAFKDVRNNRQHSQYKDWFYIDFNRDSGFNDSFWYEGWEGHYELVKLNLTNPQVREHLFARVAEWIQQLGIDGLRLDVAYMLNEDFMRGLRSFTKSLQPDFFLIGEAIHGDYNRIVNPSMLDSCTNYECYKGIYSSFNDVNMFEIAHSLNRQFGPEHWTSYKGMHLFNFVDNHDVSRIASILRDNKNLPAAYGLLFGIPGIPCVYYGSEWGEKASKTQGSDACLRPYFELPGKNGLTEQIGKFARIHKENPSLTHGGYRQLYLTNSQFVFERETAGNRVVVAINAGTETHVTGVLPTSGKLFDLTAGDYIEFGGKIELPPNSARFYRCD